FFWDANLTLTEVVTPNVAAYVQTNSSGYSILFTNENASPDEFVSSVTISNNANTNQMFITEVIGPSGSPRVIQFLYTAATTNWTKIEGSGLVNESRTTAWTTSTNRTDTIILSNNTAVVATQRTEKYRLFPWGRTLVERTLGTGSSARTTSWIYDENTNNGGYGQITNLVESSGRWERYQYDFAGRMTNHVAQFR